MNRFRPLILASVVVVSALLAYGLWTQPKPQPADAQGFSAARVVKDIEVISKENHSVAHPQERARVREYLVERLMNSEKSLLMNITPTELASAPFQTIFTGYPSVGMKRVVGIERMS